MSVEIPYENAFDEIERLRAVLENSAKYFRLRARGKGIDEYEWRVWTEAAELLEAALEKTNP